MPELLRMPEVAANTESARLSEWLVQEAEAYTVETPLATIDTDKATVDLSPEHDGVLLRTLVPAGTEVRVGEPIALISRPGEQVADVEAALAALMGDAAFRPDGTPDLSPAPHADSTAGGPGTGSEQVGERRFASPLARRLAREAGVETTTIVGTGPAGRIVRRDVERAVAEQGEAQATGPGGAPEVAHAENGTRPPEGVSSGGVPYEDIAHSRTRRAIAQRLLASKQTIPHFYVRGVARADQLLRLRAGINAGSQVKVSVNDLVLKAVACAHVQVPAMNVIWTDEAVRHFAGADVAMAVSTEAGLVTPVLRGVEGLSVTAVAATTQDFIARARGGRLYQHELEGGSTAVTNLGMYGTQEFAAIINPPQSSIVAVGAAHREPVVTAKGKVKAKSVVRVTVSVDHRCIDGATAAQWMRAFVEILEEPLRLVS